MRYLLLGLLLVSMACAARAETIFHDGVERAYNVEGTGRNAPALLVLHGGGGTGQRIKRYTRFTLSRQGWTVIYPDALDRLWNDGRTGKDGSPLRRTDDLGFLRSLLARLVKEGRIDPTRIFAVGISNGGAMAQRLVCQAPGLLAGAVVTVMTRPVGQNCPPGPPTPMAFIWGTEDPLVPYFGGPIQVRGRHRGAVISADRTLQFYADRNQCQSAGDIVLPDIADDKTRVRKVSFTGCAAPLQAYVMEGGGHVWPGRRMRGALRRILGNPVLDIDGTQIVEDFVTSLSLQ